MQIRHSLLLAALLPPATAQIQYSLASNAAPPRTEHGLVYDSARNRTIMFGGRRQNSVFQDTWAFDGTTWSSLRPATSPSLRSRPAMAYDEARDRIVLFGGFDSSNQMLNDTWTFDGNNWQQQAVSGPSVRAGAAMTYDRDRQVVVLFGGWVPSGQDDDQTWEWNGTSWTQRFPATRPGKRGAHRLAYDASRQLTVMFGGWSTPASATLGDTWTWDGNDWTQVMGAGPSNRCDPSLAFDSDRVRVTLYGGLLRFNGSSPVVTGDTWELDAAGWRPLSPPGAPSSRAYAEMAFDRANHQLVLHGGNDALLTYSDTFTLSSIDPALTTPFGTGCAGSAGVPTLAGVEHRLPWIGSSLELRIDNAATNAPFAFLVWGLSNSTWSGMMLPADLTFLGLQGCQAWISPDATILVILNNGAGTIAGPLPNNTGIVGGVFYAQAAILDPGVSMRAIPAAVTNAVEMQIGQR